MNMNVNLNALKQFRACLHGGGGPQVGEVTCLGGVTRLSIKSLILQFDHVHMTSGVSHRMLPHLAGIPHLHVNSPSGVKYFYSRI